ncbi:hypothetical protein BDY24DRAFT_385213 [Mrakia frigida]|uniref:uncharacterized protein n=1 Tax=Mrakia frigida TaxID=29902 RepID=UPI003FCC081B
MSIHSKGSFRSVSKDRDRTEFHSLKLSNIGERLELRNERSNISKRPSDLVFQGLRPTPHLLPLLFDHKSSRLDLSIPRQPPSLVLLPTILTQQDEEEFSLLLVQIYDGEIEVEPRRGKRSTEHVHRPDHPVVEVFNRICSPIKLRGVKYDVERVTQRNRRILDDDRVNGGVEYGRTRLIEERKEGSSLSFGANVHQVLSDVDGEPFFNSSLSPGGEGSHEAVPPRSSFHLEGESSVDLSPDEIVVPPCPDPDLLQIVQAGVVQRVHVERWALPGC